MIARIVLWGMGVLLALGFGYIASDRWGSVAASLLMLLVGGALGYFDREMLK